MIDEKKLINYIKTEINPYGRPFEGTVFEFGCKVMEHIENMDKVGEWIPVEERLPEEEWTYLCYEVCGNYPNYGVLNFAKNLHKVDKYDFQSKKRPGFYHFDSEYGYIEDTNVVAWMPLPAPYDMRKKVEE